MARLIETAMPRSAHSTRGAYDDDDEPGLVMTLLGTAETRLDGQRLLLNRRQTEVLALLALHPEGLSLEQLHALVYGDQAVTLSTLKAEVSHLRSTLGGQLSSRPYRLMMPATTDVDHVLALLRRGRVEEAVEAYGGTCCPAPTRPRWASWPSTSRSRSGRRCWPTRSPTPWSATASGRRTTPRSSRSASPRWRAAPTPPYPCSRAGSRSPAAEPPAGPDPPTFRQPRLPSVSLVTASQRRESSMTRISLTVDGASVSDDVEPRMLLVQYLRERLGKTGTVIGCDTSNCGPAPSTWTAPA